MFIRVLMLCCLAVPAFAKSPNVIVILTDDQGYGDLSLHGNTNLRTPHIDSLATKGAQFRHFFVQPVCSPTRAEFLTGRWHPRGGVVGVSTGGERLNLGEVTIADHFKKAGYATACFGKWHNGSQYPYHPNGRGFDEFYGFTSGHWGDYFSPPLDHNGKEVKGEGYLADDLTNKAIAWTAAQQKPFLCYLAYNTPHSPMQVPDEYWQRFQDKELKLRGGKNENLNHTRAAYAMVENLDANIGRLLAKLDEAKLTNDTIIVYFHDNGPNGNRWNAGLKGIKGSTDEGGVKSPLFVRWPGRIAEGRKVETIAGAIDLLPTLSEFAGVPVNGGKPLDGISFAKELTDGAKVEGNRTLYAAWNGKVSVRTQTVRLDAQGRESDMVIDPGQANPVNPTPLLTVQQQAVGDWRTMLEQLPKKDERPFPAGHAAMPRTVLPARDGVPHGGVKRSANAPNCSYFTNWTKTDDAMTWNIEVATAGKYEVILHYTCPAADSGAGVTMALNNVRWSGVIKDAHDPKPRGDENDRVPRVGESLVKDFAKLSLGVQSLPKGAGSLTLAARTVPGKTVADIRAVELNLQP